MQITSLGHTFASNKDDILRNLDFNREFEDYGFTDEDIAELRKRMETKVDEAVDTIFADFSMDKYLRLASAYEYAPDADIEHLTTRLMRMAQPTSRMTGVDNSRMSLYLRINVESTGQSQWDQMIRPYFPAHPLTLETPARELLTVLTVTPTPPSKFN